MSRSDRGDRRRQRLSSVARLGDCFGTPFFIVDFCFNNNPSTAVRRSPSLYTREALFITKSPLQTPICFLQLLVIFKGTLICSRGIGRACIRIDINFNSRIGAHLRAVFRLLFEYNAGLVVLVVFFGYFDIIVKEALL